MKTESIIYQTSIANPAGLKAIFAGIAEEYRKRLCEQWQMDVKDSWWVVDRPGEILCLCDIEYSLGFDDVRYFVDNATSYEDFKEWWAYNYQESLKEKSQYVNVYSWFEKGYRNEVKKGGNK